MQLFTLFTNWSSVKFSHLSDAAHCRLAPHLAHGKSSSLSCTSKLYLLYWGLGCAESGDNKVLTRHYISLQPVNFVINFAIKHDNNRQC